MIAIVMFCRVLVMLVDKMNFFIVRFFYYDFLLLFRFIAQRFGYNGRRIEIFRIKTLTNFCFADFLWFRFRLMVGSVSLLLSFSRL